MSLVLITGATGFIGSQVALQTLKAGYRVRLVIRKPEQADKLRRVLAHDDRIEFSIVPDITVSGAYDSCLRDVEYIMHIASPLASGGSTDLLTPAVRGTVSILESATKAPSVKKVVITASVLSLVSLGGIGDVDVIRGMHFRLFQITSILPLSQKQTRSTTPSTPKRSPRWIRCLNIMLASSPLIKQPSTLYMSTDPPSTSLRFTPSLSSALASSKTPLLTWAVRMACSSRI